MVTAFLCRFPLLQVARAFSTISSPLWASLWAYVHTKGTSESNRLRSSHTEPVIWRVMHIGFYPALPMSVPCIMYVAPTKPHAPRPHLIPHRWHDASHWGPDLGFPSSSPCACLSTPFCWLPHLDPPRSPPILMAIPLWHSVTPVPSMEFNNYVRPALSRVLVRRVQGEGMKYTCRSSDSSHHL